VIISNFMRIIPDSSLVFVTFRNNIPLYILYSVGDSLLGIPNYFNSGSFTLGFRLGLATLSFCSMCVFVLFNVWVLFLYCVWVFL
jgi:hypothetical protein